MRKKQVLYFMPDSPVRSDAGNKTHTLQMLEYFNSRYQQIELDYVGEQHWGGWDDQDIELFKNRFPHCNAIVMSRKMPKKNRIKYLFKHKLPKAIRKNKWLFKQQTLPNYNTTVLQKAFDSQLQKKKYDYIIISYSTWATLIKDCKYLNGARLINDTHDLVSFNLYARFKDANPNGDKKFRLGECFEREINLLSLFDETWSQSADEQYLFSQLVPGKHRFVPIMYPKHYKVRNFNSSYHYDLIYVGSPNVANQASLNWFFNYVYPLLPKNIHICIIGKICDYIPSFPNVEKHLFVRELGEYYHKSKIAICPMMFGTGVKVKTVEALSYGLPVVCNLRGLDGLPLKEGNGCLKGDTPEEFASQIKSLLDNESCYEKNKTDAINMFNRFFNIEGCYKNLDQIFNVYVTDTNISKQAEKRILNHQNLI